MLITCAFCHSILSEKRERERERDREQDFVLLIRRTTRCRCKSIEGVRVWIQCAETCVRVLQETEYRDDDKDGKAKR
jgi:hypothetical protein